MYAFGDSLLFLAVFGLAAVPATAAALFLLRPYRSFLLVLPVTALAVALRGVAAPIESLAARTAFRINPIRPLFSTHGTSAPPRAFRLAFQMSGLDVGRFFCSSSTA